MTNLILPAGNPERFAPSITGLLAQTCNVDALSGTLQPTTGDAIAMLCPIPAAITVAGQVWVNVVTAGITLTAGQNLISLHNAAGTLLATSPDQSAAWLSGGNISAQFPGGPFNLAPPYCWLQLLSVGTSTPVFRAGAASTSASMGPAAILRAQRVALGAISLSSFNPATSVTVRQIIQLGLV